MKGEKRTIAMHNFTQRCPRTLIRCPYTIYRHGRNHYSSISIRTNTTPLTSKSTTSVKAEAEGREEREKGEGGKGGGERRDVRSSHTARMIKFPKMKKSLVGGDMAVTEHPNRGVAIFVASTTKRSVSKLTT